MLIKVELVTKFLYLKKKSVCVCHQADVYKKSWTLGLALNFQIGASWNQTKQIQIHLCFTHNLKLNGLAIQFNSADLEVHPYGADVALCVRVILENIHAQWVAVILHTLWRFYLLNMFLAKVTIIIIF